MQFAIIENGAVVNVAEADEALEANWVLSAEAAIGDLFDGLSFVKPPRHSDSAEAIKSAIVAAVQARLDGFARTRNYDGILSAATYATSTIPKFAAEGQYAVQARDATWAKLYQIMDEVTAGTRAAPSGYDVIAPDLPVLTWPL